MITLWGGQERRSQRRYPCCGAVRLIYPNAVLTIPAILSDISLSGCALHLRTIDEPDTNSVVELRFRTSYLTFRCLGSVRSFVPDDLLVRVAFLGLNQRAHADIVEFIQDQIDDRTNIQILAGRTHKSIGSNY